MSKKHILHITRLLGLNVDDLGNFNTNTGYLYYCMNFR